MRLATAHNVDWQNRHHFLAVAARTMRRVLVDLARAQQSTKRGARAVHVELESGMAAADAPLPVDIVALDRALDGLAQVDKRKVQVIELRFFGGLTVEETAEILQVSPDTVARDWRTARVWLLRELSAGSG
jgi:RNA polymerase sigma factor (TIGR02999 family)